MKKNIALLLALCMVLSACVALADETEGLKDARSYINLMYKKKPASTPKDYELIGSVPGDTETYTVEWTTDSDTIAITRLEDGMVKIDVDEDNTKEVAYKLTATIKDAAGNETSISFDRFVPAAINLDIMSEEEIVAVAYTLDDGAKLPAATALCGTIVAIPSAYSEQYGNITVNIQVGDLADQIIQCYRLKGEGVADLKEGDHICVFGVIKNYKGTIEFDAGCTLIPDEYCQSARVAGFAYGLEEGAAMSRESTMSGVISAIPSAYSAEYGNITVNIDIPGLEGYTVQCYRLTGGEDLAEGDVITVTGTIKNYKGTIEFDKGCTYVKGNPEAELDAALEELLNEPADLFGEESETPDLPVDDEEKGLDLGGLLDKLGGLFGDEGELPDLNGLMENLGGLLDNGKEALDGLLDNGKEALDGLMENLGGLLGGEGQAPDLSGIINGITGGEGGQAPDLSGLLENLGGLFGK